MISGVYKTAFKFNLRDASPCNKTKQKRAEERGLAKIDYELDVANFIRFHLQTRNLLKQLFNAQKRKAAKDLKYHLDSDQLPDSDESEPASFEHAEIVAPQALTTLIPAVIRKNLQKKDRINT
jgi:hypothetical protein